jgi:membrane protein DedA with SNARE-associated domain
MSSPLLQQELQQVVSTHGYWAIALIVGLESMGVPLPGETILVLAAVYAATEPGLNIWFVISAATLGAIVGDNAGYWVGKKYAYGLLVRYGHHIGMSAPRIKVGQYLFRRHGGKVVFLGRFVALLRILAAFLAGVNRMPWRQFLVANGAGAVLWAGAFGLGGYLFGMLLVQLHHSVAMIVFSGAMAAFFGAAYLIKRYEQHMIQVAERALPGPL